MMENYKLCPMKNRYTNQVISLETEEEVVKEARRRCRTMRCYLEREDGKKIIAFDMFYKSFRWNIIWRKPLRLLQWHRYYRWRCSNDLGSGGLGTPNIRRDDQRVGAEFTNSKISRTR
jgi:hypothetical protein